MATDSKKSAGQDEDPARADRAGDSAPEPYEPPELVKFEKLEKLIVSGE